MLVTFMHIQTLQMHKVGQHDAQCTAQLNTVLVQNIKSTKLVCHNKQFSSVQVQKRYKKVQ